MANKCHVDNITVIVKDAPCVSTDITTRQNPKPVLILMSKAKKVYFREPLKWYG